MADIRKTVAILALCGSLLFVTVFAAFGSGLLSTGDEQINVEVPAVAEEIHDEGYSGDGVRIGVIDVTAVDTDDPAVSNSLVDSRTFGDSTPPHWTQSDRHGTAAGAIAGDVAPDAELYFASITDEQTFEEAVQWLLAENVDVIVAPVSFYGKPDDGTAAVEQAATAAVEAGTVFVAPAGNVGERHWRGQFLPDDAGYQRFGDAPRNQLSGDGEELVLWLSWENPDVDFSLELYRDNETEPFETAQPYGSDSYPNKRLVTTVDADTDISFALRGEEAATGTSVTVTSPTHEIDSSQRSGSLVAPGTARGVLTVGAYDVETAIIEGFSAAGPTADNRTGVDVVAPNRFEMAGEGETFVGTSAAAPYVAGIAALLLDADPTITPAEITALIRETADDRPPYDGTNRAGGGRLQPVVALEAAVEGQQTGVVENQTFAATNG